MKKCILFSALLFLSFPAHGGEAYKTIWNRYSGRPDFVHNLSSVVAGDLPGLTTNFAPGIGYRAVFSTNAVTNSGNADTPHPFIISTGTLQAGATVFASSVTALSGSFQNVYVSSAITMSSGSVVWPNTNYPGGRVMDIGSPEFMFLGGTVPAAAISSMTVNFSSHSALLIVFYTSGTTASTDIFMQFNNSWNVGASSYTMNRGTNAGAFATSTTATGLLLTGANLTAPRSFRLYLYNNNGDNRKGGEFSGQNIPTASSNSGNKFTGNFSYWNGVPGNQSSTILDPLAPVTSVTVSLRATGSFVPPTSLKIYGNDDLPGIEASP